MTRSNTPGSCWPAKSACFSWRSSRRTPMRRTGRAKAMISGERALSPDRANLALATLFAGMFALGSAELLVVGVLNLIAADLGVSIPAAGTLVTAYALGLAIGGPILTALTIRLDRRTVLAGALALFIVGNLVAVLTARYDVFLAARAVTRAMQGLFIAAAFAAGIAVGP